MASHSAVLVLCSPMSMNALSRLEPVPSEAAVGLLDKRACRRRGRSPVGGATAGRAAAPRRGARRRPCGIGRPGQAVADFGTDLVGRLQVALAQGRTQVVTLVAGAVGAVGQPGVVRTDRSRADGEVIGALGPLVLVEQDLLVGPGLAGGWELIAAPGGAAAVDAELFPSSVRP